MTQPKKISTVSPLQVKSFLDRQRILAGEVSAFFTCRGALMATLKASHSWSTLAFLALKSLQVAGILIHDRNRENLRNPILSSLIPLSQGSVCRGPGGERRQGTEEEQKNEARPRQRRGKGRKREAHHRVVVRHNAVTCDLHSQSSVFLPSYIGYGLSATSEQVLVVWTGWMGCPTWRSLPASVWFESQ